MKTRLYSPQDYQTALDWWHIREHPEVPSVILPRCGVVVEATAGPQDGDPLMIGWLYLDNSVGVAMLAFMIGNPHSTTRTAAMALQHLAECARQVAAELGYPVLLVTAKESVSRFLGRHGFTKTSGEPHFHLMKVTPRPTTGGIR